VLGVVITKCKTDFSKMIYNGPVALVVGMLDIPSGAVSLILLIRFLLDFDDALLPRREGM